MSPILIVAAALPLTVALYVRRANAKLEVARLREKLALQRDLATRSTEHLRRMIDECGYFELRGTCAIRETTEAQRFLADVHAGGAAADIADLVAAEASCGMKPKDGLRLKEFDVLFEIVLAELARRAQNGAGDGNGGDTP
ncbi:MAG TPA: hypothetical protein VIA18_16535 [Polyangia bacterium]|jgi:hypothetical protein|nr:hypothetical protein [Polyangia bacterium]